jgi:hypothetical protein
MVKALFTISSVEIYCRPPHQLRVYGDSTLVSYIDEDSWLCFKLCGIEYTFFNYRRMNSTLMPIIKYLTGMSIDIRP